MKKAIIPILLFMLIFTSCKSTSNEQITKFADIDNQRIGVQTGAIADFYISENYKDVKITRFNSIMDEAMALKSNKIDAFLAPTPTLVSLVAKNPELKILDEEVCAVDSAVAVRKEDTELKQQINEALTKLQDDGTISQIFEKWTKDPLSLPPMSDIKIDETLPTLTIATNSTFEPYSFKDEHGDFVGTEIELAMRVCQIIGRNPKFIDVNVDGLVTALVSGKADAIFCILGATEERKQQVDFTVSYFKITQSLVVKK